MTGDFVPRPTGLLIVAVIIACMCIGTIHIPRAIDSFEELFKVFGADLPAVTRLVLATRYAWYLFAAIGISLAAWIIARSNVGRAEIARMKLAVTSFILLFLLAFGITFFALYLPIFRLGAVV